MARPVINPHSLKNFYAWGEPVGYSFTVNYNRYRNIPLSCIEKFALKVDGGEVPNNIIHFCLNGKKFQISELKDMYNEYWAMQEPASIEVDDLAGLSEGPHEIDLYILGRSPYIPTPFYITDPDSQPHTYMNGNMGEKAVLWLQK